MREFKDIAAFISHMQGTALRCETAGEVGLERAGRLVKAEAVREIGHYQLENTGPFFPWPELADSTKDDRVKQGFPENEPGLRTGVARDSIASTGNATERVIGSNDQNLDWFEFGTEKQPPRSVLGVAAFRKESQAVDSIATAVVGAVAGVSAGRVLTAHNGRIEDDAQ